MSPKEAYEYAKKYGPSNETREIACEDPEFAYEYAKNVDKCPKEDTRKAACVDPESAYFYARSIDKCFHQKTWNAIRKTEYAEEYRKIINNMD